MFTGVGVAKVLVYPLMEPTIAHPLVLPSPVIAARFYELLLMLRGKSVSHCPLISEHSLTKHPLCFLGMDGNASLFLPYSLFCVVRMPLTFHGAELSALGIIARPRGNLTTTGRTEPNNVVYLLLVRVIAGLRTKTLLSSRCTATSGA